MASLIGSVACATVVIPGGFPDPSADTFGTLIDVTPGSTFGGTGIPTNAVAISTVVDGANTITLGLAATPRFGAPTPGNDGMGAYTVNTGEGEPGRSLWNFSYYMSIDGGGTFADYAFTLAYDLDAASGTDLSNHGSLALNAFASGGVTPLTSITTFEDSQNATFGFLNVPFPGAVVPPAPPATFDLGQAGEYTFQLRVNKGLDIIPLDSVSISVAAIPEPTAALFGTLLAGGLGVTVARRRREED